MSNFGSAKRIAKYVCLITFALLCIIMLSLSTLYFPSDLKISYLIKPDNGFKWLTFGSNILSGSTWDIVKIPIGLLSIAQLVFGLVAVAVVAYNFVKRKDESNKKIIIGGFVSMILYAFEGIIVKTICYEDIGALFANYLSTGSFIPLIIGALAIAAYYIIDKLAPISEVSKIERLSMYSDLLEKGIITQEEFDAKKKQLLDL